MSLIRTRKKIVSSAIASSLSMIATTAMAQEAVSQLPTIHTQATQEESLKVDQSANAKFVAPLKDTPKSVSILSQKLIKDTNSNTLLEALRYEPGITLGAGEGGTPYTDMPIIRGYNSQNSIYVDGVRNATSQSRDMFAVEQVEVIKGSSSALGGGGSIGGSINLVTKLAHEGDVYQGSVQGGTDNYRHIQLDANKDFDNGIAGRVVVMGHENEKAGQNDGAEYARVGIAPSISLGLGSPNRATLSYYFLKSNDEPDAGIPFNNPNIPTNAPVGTEKGDGKPIGVKQGTYYGWKARDFDKRENHIGTLKLEHDFDENLTLSNVATYTKSKADYINSMPDDSKGNIYTGKVWRRSNGHIRDTSAFSDQLSLKGKFNTGIIKHNFNIGAEYAHQETDKASYLLTDSVNGINVNNGDALTGACSLGVGAASNYWCTNLNNPNPNDPWLGSIGINPTSVNTVTSKTTSLYALDSIELHPQWLLDLGVRWDKFDTEQVTQATGAKLESDTDYFSYQAGIVYKPTEQGSIYASYATSASPVGISQGDGENDLGAAYLDLKPEKARTIELGTKWDLFNERANITAAIFRTEKTDSRVTDSDGTTRNIGNSKVDGFELGLNGKITDKWDIAAGYSYLDSELTKGNQNSAGLLVEGKALPFVAKNSATLWSTYQVLPKLTLGAGLEYRDMVYTNTNPTTATTSTKFLPTYTLYNAMAKYDVNKNVNLQLNVNNISDKRYFTGAHASHYANEGNGRNAVLAINFKY
ncbi:TonB-dependent receptor [Acinetobacter pittii]|uniref:TonB-dependent receptor n=1 Tax=Acinetobacter pittii TaxID=48296 RepID=UPI002A06EE70|nr:TonB-dependent receptor [Acinetobacter pittii]MDX8239089.1 TonB-dependent receptor [Acinetobacter pittii]